MKGIVVEIKGKTAIVLKDDGSFDSLRNNEYKIGEVILTEKVAPFARRRQFRRFGAVAAAFALFTAGAYAYSLPVAYVSVDINPSIAYELNMFDRVLSVKAMDESAEEIMQLLDLENMSIQKAVRVTTEQLISSGYIDGEDNNIVLVAGSDNSAKAEKLAAQLTLKVQETIDKKGKKAEVNAESVSLGRVEEAKALDVTPGKLNLVQELIDIDEDYEEEDQPALLEQSVKEINKEIKENRKATKVEGEEEQEADNQVKEKNQLEDDNKTEGDNQTEQNKQEEAENEKETQNGNGENKSKN